MPTKKSNSAISSDSGNSLVQWAMRMVIAFAIFPVFASNASGADGYSAGYAPFSSGNTVMACKHPPDARITQDNFNKVFPSLASYIYKKWKARIVARVYFLRTVDEGIVLILNDGDGKKSEAVADGIMTDIVRLFASSNIPLKASCVTHSIGPLWLGDYKN